MWFKAFKRPKEWRRRLTHAAVSRIVWEERNYLVRGNAGQNGVNGVPDFRLRRSIRTFTPPARLQPAQRSRAAAKLHIRILTVDSATSLNPFHTTALRMSVPRYSKTCLPCWLPKRFFRNEKLRPWPTGDPQPTLVKITEPLLYGPCDTAVALSQPQASFLSQLLCYRQNISLHKD